MNSFWIRALTGVVLVSVMFWTIYFPGPNMIYFLAVTLFFVVTGLYEYFQMVLPPKKYSQVPFLISLGGSLGMVAWSYSASLERFAISGFRLPSEFALDFIRNFPATGVNLFFIVFVALLAIFVFLIYTERMDEAPSVIGGVIVPFFYIAIPVSVLLLLRSERDGVFLLYMVAFMTSSTDIAGYAFGKTMGKHKIGWKLSPNKTWEGYIGGIIGQVVMTFAAYWVIRPLLEARTIAPFSLLIISIAVYFLAVVGDLSESLIKRSAGVKDSGKLMPGHGGVLDRIDSFLITLPGFYLIVKMFL